MSRDYARNSRSSRDTERSGPSGIVWLLIGVLVGLIIAGIFYLKNQPQRGISAPPAATKSALPQQQNSTANPAEKNSTKPATPSTQNLQTQFDFYNVLPSQKVVGPSGDEDTSAINNQTQTQTPASQTSTTTTVPVNNTPTATNTNQANTTSASSTPKPVEPKVAPVVAAQPTFSSSNKKSVATSSATPTSTTPAKPLTYIVQIATFSNEDEVDKLKAQLSLLGFEVNVSSVEKNGKALKRVWVGPYHSMPEAENMQKQLQENQITSKVLKNS